MAHPPTPPRFDPEKKKSQHFVPQLWQRRFADPAGNVWARYRRGADPFRNKRPRLAGKARQVSVTVTMTEDWLYTIFDKWWRPSNAVEDAISKDERLIASVFDKVSDPNVVVTPQIVEDLSWAIGLAACRTPEVMRRGHRRAKELASQTAKIHSYPDKNTFLADIHARFGVLISDAEYQHLLTRTDEQLRAEADWIEGMSTQDPLLPQQNALLGARLIGDEIAAMALTIIHAPAPVDFILGDTPLPDASLAQGFAVPISAKVALHAEPPGARQAGSLHVRPARLAEVSIINKRQHEMSRDVVIGPDPDILDAL